MKKMIYAAAAILMAASLAACGTTADKGEAEKAQGSGDGYPKKPFRLLFRLMRAVRQTHSVVLFFHTLRKSWAFPWRLSIMEALRASSERPIF